MTAIERLEQLMRKAQSGDRVAVGRFYDGMGFMAPVQLSSEHGMITIILREAQRISEGYLIGGPVEFGIGQLGEDAFKKEVARWGWHWEPTNFDGQLSVRLFSPEFEAQRRESDADTSTGG